MMRQLLEAFKKLYVKIKCSLCCRSKCSVQVGNPTEQTEEGRIMETSV
jgi:hypothetical protein